LKKWLGRKRFDSNTEFIDVVNDYFKKKELHHMKKLEPLLNQVQEFREIY